MSRIVVVGIGSPDGGDDAAGLAVARRVAGWDGVAVVESTGDPLALIGSWDGADLAVVVDAVRSGAAAGTVHRLDVAWVPHHARGGSSHALSLPEAVGIARALGRLPRRLVLLGIDGRHFGVGAPMTPEVAGAVARCVEIVKALVCDVSAGGIRDAPAGHGDDPGDPAAAEGQAARSRRRKKTTAAAAKTAASASRTAV